MSAFHDCSETKSGKPARSSTQTVFGGKRVIFGYDRAPLICFRKFQHIIFFVVGSFYNDCKIKKAFIKTFDDLLCPAACDMVLQVVVFPLKPLYFRARKRI